MHSSNLDVSTEDLHRLLAGYTPDPTDPFDRDDLLVIERTSPARTFHECLFAAFQEADAALRDRACPAGVKDDIRILRPLLQHFLQLLNSQLGDVA